MKQLARVFVAFLVFSVGIARADTRVVAIVDGRVVRDPLKNPLTLSGDFNRPCLPVWSPDGTTVAFVAAGTNAVATLVVVTADGRLVTSTSLEPHHPGLVYRGMRFVESVEWVSRSTLLVGGSINPSQSQYYLVSLGEGNRMIGFTDDRSAPSVSPDGRHYASVSGIPHFGGLAYGRPELVVDGRSVFAAGTSPISFGDGPIWSSDSREVALLIGSSREEMLLIWRRETRTREFIKTPLSRAFFDSRLYWTDGRLRIVGRDVAGKSHSWLLDTTEREFHLDREDRAADPTIAAIAVRDGLRDEVLAHRNIQQPDFWCNDCSLNVLPRRVDSAGS